MTPAPLDVPSPAPERHYQCAAPGCPFVTDVPAQATAHEAHGYGHACRVFPGPIDRVAIGADAPTVPTVDTARLVQLAHLLRTHAFVTPAERDAFAQLLEAAARRLQQLELRAACEADDATRAGSGGEVARG